MDPRTLFERASKNDNVIETVAGNEQMWMHDRLCSASNAVVDAAELLRRIGREKEAVAFEDWAWELWELRGEWWRYENGGRPGAW